ncbi:lactate 2-monooxygenase [Aspergillus homomorphus CBS 101889]|uniref:FMN-dependent alpha-hydroxy acid dehydrogenase n=1 Tax=Aspergillus homomorphus (strain CBS 101889) TaxID=1450537 RepID=A0A395HXS4_ASPHC|nr:FMN-dependent alpha-hydroxy acid dehydrogenase [Aspergillus homomorphus CBS 101889]RAL11044.1 FMN-dependent alpha-hydroxy acid dehydrogenase [Aspergillus homomorphus CBS 101889]
MSQTYGNYRSEICSQGATSGVTPAVTTDPRRLEDQAKTALGIRSFNYIAGGAGEKATMDRNRLAFRQWKIVPRMLKQMENQDISVNLFGEKYPNPSLVAPVRVQSIFHEDKETGLAEVCGQTGVPYILSTASSSSIEDVAKANGDGKRWFQLYWPMDDDITLSLLKRAKENGFGVLMITLDTWSLAWRPADLDNAYIPFIKGIGNEIGFTDPVFRAKYEKESGSKVEDDILGASKSWSSQVFSGVPHTWDQVAFLRKNWDDPLLLKGIQHLEDAKLALEAGCDGIVVSNHGGRQVDGAIGSLEVLPEIVDAVGVKMTILFDSGIRTGADVIKALCLGAKAVLIGRPIIYGLAIDGKKGAELVMRGLLADVWQNMGLSGIRSVAECYRDKLRKVVYPGDGIAMM